MKPLKYAKRDYVAYGIVVLYLVLGIALNRLAPYILTIITENI
jgi:hypothetical protein